ncbi:MAG: nucleotide exchange factor GrpE [Cyanobacteria bacterium P01_A01_bin.135]
MMIEDEKPVEETQENVSPADEAVGGVDANSSDGPTLDEVDLDLEEVSAEQSAEQSAPDEGPQPEASGTAADGHQELDRLRGQLDERMGQYVRIAADFENFRKRTQKERQELEVQVKCSTISELLPVIDNFERARSQIKPQTDGEMTIHKSYQGVYKQLVDALKKLGVSPMRAEGEQFDPNLHEAVMREPTSEYEDGTVIEQLMRGYVVGERVLRHAMVKVATAPEGGDSQGNDVAE